jgi:hypothetical protein
MKTLAAEFINVDLDLKSAAPLTPLLQAWSGRVGRLHTPDKAGRKPSIARRAAGVGVPHPGLAVHSASEELDMQEFLIAPAASRAMWFLLLVPGVVICLVAGLLGAALLGSRGARFEVSPAGLRLRGDLYGRLIPMEQLRAGSASRIDFSAMPELTLVRRTMGTGLPGYRAGWFRLKNGERALVYLTDETRAVYVPTTAGYSVVVSPREPDQFLAALRTLSARQ